MEIRRRKLGWSCSDGAALGPARYSPILGWTLAGIPLAANQLRVLRSHYRDVTDVALGLHPISVFRPRLRRRVFPDCLRRLAYLLGDSTRCSILHPYSAHPLNTSHFCLVALCETLHKNGSNQSLQLTAGRKENYKGEIRK